MIHYTLTNVGAVREASRGTWSARVIPAGPRACTAFQPIGRSAWRFFPCGGIRFEKFLDPAIL